MKRFAPAIISLSLFSVIAVLQAGGMLQQVDESVLLMIRGAHPDHPPASSWLLPLLYVVTWFGDFPALLFVATIATGLLLFSKRKPEASSFACSAILGVLLMLVLKEVFARPRPQVVPALADVSTLSFPSGHALMSVAVYVPLAMILLRTFPQKNAQCFTAFGLFLLVIGFSRLYLGVHYLTDVLAGWVLGVFVVVVCRRSIAGSVGSTVPTHNTVELTGGNPTETDEE
ncbi:MAG: phosphatase PAP2 family protein [Bacteroidia bacterium]|nr:phosphatase PAP2 family protein [Bacteroidia bacterium]